MNTLNELKSKLKERAKGRVELIVKIDGLTEADFVRYKQAILRRRQAVSQQKQSIHDIANQAFEKMPSELQNWIIKSQTAFKRRLDEEL